MQNIPNEKLKVEDKVSVAIHTMTPEEKARVGTPEDLERQRRIKAVPAAWYCVAANPEESHQGWWIKGLKPQDWIKVVNDNGTVLFGKTIKIIDGCVKLVTDTVLFDNQIDTERTGDGMCSLQNEDIVQVFTANKDVADLIQKERKSRNGNG